MNLPTELQLHMWASVAQERDKLWDSVPGSGGSCTEALYSSTGRSVSAIVKMYPPGEPARFYRIEAVQKYGQEGLEHTVRIHKYGQEEL